VTADSDNPEVDPRQVEAFEPLPGDLLVAARRSRGMSTAKAAAALNLDESVVLALEENRFSDLGAPVFARGHLRKYAHVLGLNPDDVIRAYDAVATEQSAASMNVSPTVAQPVSGKSGHWMLRVLVLVVLAALAVVVWRILKYGDGLIPTPAIIAPVQSPALTSSEEPSPVPIIDDRPEQIAGGGAEPGVPGQETPGQETAQVAAPPGPSAGGGPLGSATAETAASAEPPAPAATDVPGSLVFVFDQDSWLEVRDADGRRLAYELGRHGTRRTITGRGPFRVSLGYWPGVSVSYGGESVSIPESARQGNTARFSVPADADN